MALNRLRQTVFSVVDIRARLFPTDTAFLIPSRLDQGDVHAVTYAELRAGAWRQASRLRAIGVGPGTPVGI